MEKKMDLAAVSNQVEALKKILENANEITKLLEKNPDIMFSYTIFFRDKSISAKTIAEKMAEKVLPEITKIVALKIAERAKLEKQIGEKEGGAI